MLFSTNSKSGQIESYTDQGEYAGIVCTMGDFISEDQQANDGGPGSGNHGHKGRPGQRGGSAGEGSAAGGSESSPKLKEGTNFEDLQEVEIDPNFDIFEWMSQHEDDPDDEPSEYRKQQEAAEKEKKDREEFGQNGLLESEYPEDLRLTDKEKKTLRDLFRSYKDDNFKSDAGPDVMDALSGLTDKEKLDQREKKLREAIAESTEEIERKKASGYSYKTHNPDSQLTRKQKLARWWNEVMTTGAPQSNWEERGIRYWQILRSNAVKHLGEIGLARKLAGRNEFAEKSDKYMPWRKNPNRDNPHYKPWKNANDGGPGSGNFGHSGRPGKVGGSGEGEGSEYASRMEKQRNDLLQQSAKDQSYFLLESGMLDYKEAVEAWHNGTAEKFVNQYFDIMEKNGDPEPTKEPRTAPDLNDEVMYKKKWSTSNNGLTDEFTTARLSYIQEWTGCDERQAWDYLNEMGTWFSGSWGRADTDMLDKYIDDDGVYDGEIYRGIELSPSDYDEFMKNAQPGGTVKMIGMNSSWTTDEEMATHFAGNSEDSRHIVFKCIKNKTAAPVSHLSTHGEDEVLAHSRAQWSVLNVHEGTSRTIITVVESEHRMSEEERDKRREQYDSVPDKGYESLQSRMESQQKYFVADPPEKK